MVEVIVLSSGRIAVPQALRRRYLEHLFGLSNLKSFTLIAIRLGQPILGRLFPTFRETELLQIWLAFKILLICVQMPISRLIMKIIAIFVVLPVVHKHRVWRILAISNLVFVVHDLLSLFVVLAARLDRRIILSGRNNPRRLFIRNIVLHFRIGLDSEFFILLDLSGHIAGMLLINVFVVEAIEVMVIHCHEVGDSVLIRIIILLRIE